MTWRVRNPDFLAKVFFTGLACGGIPIVLLFHGIWGAVLLKAYLLTVFLLFALIWGYWEVIARTWFWKAMVVIVAIHCAILVGLVHLNLSFPNIDRLPRIVYSALSLVCTAEVLASMRLVEALRPNRKPEE
jgi:hypothetical protein